MLLAPACHGLPPGFVRVGEACVGGDPEAGLNTDGPRGGAGIVKYARTAPSYVGAASDFLSCERTWIFGTLCTQLSSKKYTHSKT